jgi:hypothetical protein
MNQSTSSPQYTHLRRMCLSHRVKTARALIPLIVLLFMWAAMSAASAGASNPVHSSAAEDAPVLTLSNEHLGMTAEEIEASQASPVIETAAVEPQSPDELQAHADALAVAAEQAKQRAIEAAAHAETLRLAVVQAERAEVAGVALATAGAGVVSAAAGDEPEGTSYESCVEASVRRGVDYAESDRVCRAAFPEQEENTE